MELPKFRYHPDPISTGFVKRSGRRCSICDAQRGFIYTGPSYGRHDRDAVFCPWCIANGDAAKRHGLVFTDRDHLNLAGVDDTVVREVTLRTPGFTMWDDQVWTCHCGDVCEFHGVLTLAEARKPNATALAAMLSDTITPADWWQKFVSSYQPGGQRLIYKFVCRHCSIVLYEMEFY